MIAEWETRLSRRLSAGQELRQKQRKSQERKRALEQQAALQRSQVDASISAADSRARLTKAHNLHERSVLYASTVEEWHRRKMIAEQKIIAERERKEEIARLLLEEKHSRWSQNHSRLQESQSEQRLYKQHERRLSHEKVKLNKSLREDEFNTSLFKSAQLLHAENELQQLFLRRLAMREKTEIANQQKELQISVRVLSLQKSLSKREAAFKANKSQLEHSRSQLLVQKADLHASKQSLNVMKKQELELEEQEKLAYLEALTSQRIQEVLRNKAELENRRKQQLEVQGVLLDQSIRDRQSTAVLLRVGARSHPANETAGQKTRLGGERGARTAKQRPESPPVRSLPELGPRHELSPARSLELPMLLTSNLNLSRTSVFAGAREKLLGEELHLERGLNDQESKLGEMGAPEKKKIFTWEVIFSTIMLCSSGTFSIMSLKIQGTTYTFKHSMLQTFLMFLGEYLNLLYFAIPLMMSKAQRETHFTELRKTAIAKNRKLQYTKLWAALPCLLDAVGSGMSITSLLLLPASVCQMLQGGQIVTVCLFSKWINNRPILKHHGAGVGLASIGFIFVGIAGYIAAKGEQNSKYTVGGFVMGIIFIVINLIFQAVQSNVEERIMTKFE